VIIGQISHILGFPGIFRKPEFRKQDAAFRLSRQGRRARPRDAA
jgi:hypothetical protein